GRLWRGADECDAVELEQEEVRGRVDPAQRAIELERRRRRRALGALRENDLEGVAGPDVLLRPDDAPLVIMARRQSPCGAGPPSSTPARIGLRAAEEVCDLVRIPTENLRHPQPVVEADERVGDDEAALRQVAPVAGQGDRRLEPCGVVVTEVAD